MSHRARRNLPGLVLGTILGLVACSPGASTSPSAPVAPTVVPTSAPTAPPSPSPSAAASSTTGGTLCAREFETCEIASGTYVVTPFTPEFRVTIPDGLVNARNWPTGGGFGTPQGGFWWASDVRAAIKGESEIELEPTTDAFIEHLRSYEEFAVTDPVPVTIAGVDGVAVDVTTGSTPVRGLYLIPEDAYNLDPGSKARFHLVEHAGTTVLFIIEAYQAADFDALVTQFQPVLDSVTWTA
jgi:hypothetical protein